MSSYDWEKVFDYTPTTVERYGPNSKYVVLVSNNGQSFAIPREAANLSCILWSILRDPSGPPYNDYYIPELNGAQLKLAVMFLIHEANFLEEDFEFFEAPKGQEQMLEEVRSILKA